MLIVRTNNNATNDHNNDNNNDCCYSARARQTLHAVFCFARACAKNFTNETHPETAGKKTTRHPLGEVPV